MDTSLIVDLLVVGDTAPGIVTAVRAARAGLQVLLVSASPVIGGSLPSLGAIETHYRGNRAPLLQEIIAGLCAHYRERYGAESPQYRTCAGRKMIVFEPHICVQVLERLVAAERNLRVWRGWRVGAVQTRDRRVETVDLVRLADGATRRIRARAWVEAGYEGDFMALAGVEFRLGREAREAFGEPRAGKVFTRWITGEFPRAAVEGKLNLVTAGATTSEPLPGSTGAGDDHIQSYSYRLCLTDDPGNRRVLTSPPEGYERARYAPILLAPAEKARLPLPFHHRFLIYSLREMAERDHIFHGHALPNRKRSWNATNFTGAGKHYPSADPVTRREIERRHREHALGLLWFLQNDAEIPEDLRAQARAWGLARDEFTASDNLPSQLYVREARRLVGRAVFTENDALIAPGAERAPIHADAVAITEFSLDSLACTTERLPGGESLCDGQLFQMEVSRPGQLPFGVMLPRDIDNLLVVTTVSATHVAWGTVRQTPTLMHLAEAAAWAIVLAAREGVAPAAVEVETLQRTLVEHGVMITFFNDVDMSVREPWLPAVQLCGARGYFPSYDCGPHDLLDDATAGDWSRRSGVPAATLRGRSRSSACELIHAACATESVLSARRVISL